MALEHIHFNTWNRTVRDVLRGENGATDGQHLILDPEYQRASVWTPEQRVNLIKSSLQGLPVGVVFLNDRGYSPDRKEFAVVDGKQRLETYIDWFNDKLAVPMGWFDPSQIMLEDGVYNPHWTMVYSDLNPVEKRRIANGFTLATYETKLKTVAEEAELYFRINYGGTPHESLEGSRRV